MSYDKEITEQTLTDKEQNEITLSEFLQKTDRILSNKDVTLFKINNSTSYKKPLAFCNVSRCTIHLNFEQMYGYKLDENGEMALLKGLNYHELAHILFTRVSKTLQTNEVYAQLFNSIEDGRIETAFSLIYPKAQKYFETTIAEVLVKDKEVGVEPLSFLLFYARHLFLDRALDNNNRNVTAIYEGLFKNKYGDAKTTKTKELIDKFLVSNTLKEQEQIVIKLAKLLDLKAHSLPKCVAICIGGLSLDMNRTSKSMSDLLKQLAKQGITGVDAEAVKKAIEDTLKELDKIRKLEQELDNLEKEHAKKEKDGNDNSWGDFWAKENKLKRQLDELKDKIKLPFLQRWADAVRDTNAESINSEVEHDKEHIRSVGTGLGLTLQKVGITSQDKVISENLKKVLWYMKNELKEKYVHNQKKGKINLRKCMSFDKTANLRLYKKYLPNRIDKSSLGVFILLDASSSMGQGDFNKALRCGWILGNALEKIGNGVSVLQFSDGFAVTKNFNQLPKFERIFSGGTNPITALKYVKDKIEKDKSYKNWLVFIITDGDWSCENENEAMIKELNRFGVETAVIFFNSYNNTLSDDNTLAKAGLNEQEIYDEKLKHYNDKHFQADFMRHEAKHLIKIDNMNELGFVFRSLVRKFQKSITESILRGY